MSFLWRGARIVVAAIKHDLKKMLGKPDESAPAGAVEMTLTPENCYLADDALKSWENADIANWVFRIQEENSLFSEEQLFHMTMFFDKLLRRKDITTAQKFYYRDMVKHFAMNAHKPELTDSVTTGQLVERAKGAIKGLKQNIRRGMSLKGMAPERVNHVQKPSPEQWKKVLITGWYGTETAGDKAILGEVVHFIQERSPSCEIMLTTLDRKISLQTNKELEGLKGVALVDMDAGCNPRTVEMADAVIIGGGPLMQSDSMGFIRSMFREANRQKKARVIFGCGMGPFHTEEMVSLTAEILRLTTAGFFRDEESLEEALHLAPGAQFESACDPAMGFLQRNRPILYSGQEKTPPSVAALLRATTREFKAGFAQETIERDNLLKAGSIARMLESACRLSGKKARLLAMNSHWMGGDDRLFNRLVEVNFTDKNLVETERKYLTLTGLIRTLGGAESAVAMRYHGNLFCLALGIPFLSIDYTGKKGKVSNLLRRIGHDEWSERWGELDEKRATGKLATLIESRREISRRLIQKSDEMAKGLTSVYTKLFS